VAATAHAMAARASDSTIANRNPPPLRTRRFY
jgi:hypothetical protein